MILFAFVALALSNAPLLAEEAAHYRLGSTGSMRPKERPAATLPASRSRMA